MKIPFKIALACMLAPAALAAQPAPPKNVSPSSVPATYKISPGDQLEIYVWGDERLQRPMSVLPDGTFAFPLAGTVTAQGRTPAQVESELSRLLAPQYKGVAPQVTVSVRQPSGMQVSVIGKVRAPGTFSPIRYVTLIDVLALAGGPTEFADVNNIVILRHVGDHTSVVRSRVGSVLKGKPTDNDLTGAGNPQLVAGDTVVVP